MSHSFQNTKIVECSASGYASYADVKRGLTFKIEAQIRAEANGKKTGQITFSISTKN